MVLIGGHQHHAGAAPRRDVRLDVSRPRQHQSWLQEIVYGALSILAITLLPDGVVGRVRNSVSPVAGRRAPSGSGRDVAAPQPAGDPCRQPLRARPPASRRVIVECRGIEFGYDLETRRCSGRIDLHRSARGHIHGLIGPNGSSKSTLANIISEAAEAAWRRGAGQGRAVERMLGQRTLEAGPPGASSRRRSWSRSWRFVENVGRRLFDRRPANRARALASGLCCRVRPSRQPGDAAPGRPKLLRLVGAGEWLGRPGWATYRTASSKLTQSSASIRVGPDIIILDEPATGLSSGQA